MAMLMVVLITCPNVRRLHLEGNKVRRQALYADGSWWWQATSRVGMFILCLSVSMRVRVYVCVCVCASHRLVTRVQWR